LHLNLKKQKNEPQARLRLATCRAAIVPISHLFQLKLM
jgi:hypothetical protein